MADKNRVDTNDLIETLKARVISNSGYFLSADEVNKLVMFIAAVGSAIGGAISGSYITTRPSASVTADINFAATAAAKARHNS